MVYNQKSREGTSFALEAEEGTVDVGDAGTGTEGLLVTSGVGVSYSINCESEAGRVSSSWAAPAGGAGKASACCGEASAI